MLVSRGVASESGEEVSDPSNPSCKGGTLLETECSVAPVLCKLENGVEALVVGSGEYEVDGEGALEALPSRENRIGLTEESYGFGRVFETFVLDGVSFFRFDGARLSGTEGISLFNNPLTCGHSGCSRPVKLPMSSGGLLAVEVLWSSVIMIGLDIPDPTMRPASSIIEK